MASRVEVVDLITPLLPPDPASPGHGHLHARARVLLDTIRHQRAVLAVTPEAADDLARLRGAAAHLERDLADTVSDLAAAAVELGANVPATLILAVTEHDEGDAIEVLPSQPPAAALLLDRLRDPPAVTIGRALAAITRWTDPDSASAVRRAMALTDWQRTRFLDLVPLGEWLYTEGLGLHLARALAPALAPHELVGVGKSAFARLREQERALTLLLESELPRQGCGPWGRWLDDAGRLPARALDGSMIPVGAGRYLAWRLTADRVHRLGLAAALREEA